METRFPGPRDAEASMLTAMESPDPARPGSGPLPPPTGLSFTRGLGRSTGPSPGTGLLLGPGQGLSHPVTPWEQGVLRRGKRQDSKALPAVGGA